MCVCRLATVGKADAAATLMAQQSADISSEKVATQPNPLAAAYNIGIITSYHFSLTLVVLEILKMLLQYGDGVVNTTGNSSDSDDTFAYTRFTHTFHTLNSVSWLNSFADFLFIFLFIIKSIDCFCQKPCKHLFTIVNFLCSELSHVRLICDTT